MNKRILKLAVPNILSNLSVPLLSSVDTAVVGHLEGIYYLGAIAIGSMIFNFIYWGFGFLRMGTTGITAQAYGSKNKFRIAEIFFRSLLIAVIIGIILIVLRPVILLVSFSLIDVSSDVSRYAVSYFNIRILAAPATLGLYVFHGWYLGIQNARIPLILTVFVNILNIGLNLLFVYHYDMKSDGVALGTVISQYFGLIMASSIFYKGFREYHIFIKIKTLLNSIELRKFVQINSDIFIRTLMLIFAFSFFIVKSGEMGDHILAANTILLQFWTILSYGIDGFAFSAESLVGMFLGSRDKKNYFKAIRFSFYWASGLGFILMIIYFVFSEMLIAVFTSNEFIQGICSIYIGYTIGAPVLNSVCYIWDGIYLGAAVTRPLKTSMVVSALFIFLPIFYFLEPYLGNHALWWALLIFMAARGIILTFYSKRHVFSLI
ncbi:MAG: MATE family efflux transporter [Melioribacteraceae bacterium]|nr:MATE family efflux transporter [Melioribacteraceae bacterium]